MTQIEERMLELVQQQGRALIKEKETAKTVTLLYCNGRAFCRILIPRNKWDAEKIKTLWNGYKT